MRILIKFKIILILFSTCFLEGQTFYNASELVELISDIKQFYKATTVVLVHDIKYENVFEMDFMFHLSRMLLRKNLTLIHQSIHMMKSSENVYKGRIGRPLIVVFLTSERSIQELETHSANVNLVSPFWLIIFWKIDEKPSYDYCKDPVGNPFRSSFNTEMLIKCYEDENIYEWYSLYKNKTEVELFATWDKKNRLNLKAKNQLYMRRNQLGAVHLRIAAVQEHSNHTGVSKLMENTVLELSHVLNFNIYYNITENVLGSWNYITNEWSGMMRYLSEGEIDMSVTPMIMSSKRLEYVDFSHPLILSPSLLYIKKPNTLSTQWLGHFQTFSCKVWYSIIVFMLIIPVMLSFMKMKINESNVSYTLLLYNNYFNVWRIFCQQGLIESTSYSSVRIVYFSTFITSWIIISLYSAYLISHLTLLDPPLPFNDIKGFLADGTYKLIVLKDSVEYDLFQNTSDPTLKKMKLLMKSDDHLPAVMEEALQQVCREKVVLYTNKAKRESQASVLCSLAAIKTGRIDSIALALTKNSQYLGLINFHLQRFVDNGIMNKFKRNTMTDEKGLSKLQYVEVEFQGVEPILVIILGGIGISLLILLLEKMCFFYKNNKCG